MMSNANLEIIQTKLPEFYKKYEYKSDKEKSVMHAVLSAIVKNIDNSNSIVDRVDACLGIDTTYDQDLQYRWGDLLGISKKETDSYDLYRNELKLAIPSLIGGTKGAIAYAMAIVVGIEKDDILQSDYIKVIDGWEYDGDADIPDEYRQYGCFVCVIDMSVGQGAVDVEQQMVHSVNRVKASGTSFYVVYKEFHVARYYKLDVFNYDTLDNIMYSNLGTEE